MDLRGLRVSDKAELRRVAFNPADFGAASWKGAWIERCTFNKAKFDGAGFQNVAEHGNEFIGCSFLKTSFREAAVGYKGSRFDTCTFDRVDFNRAVFVRPEFDGCAFYHCKLDGCDLNGSSFERCRFVGRLRDVWFRGDFGYPDDASRYGQPRANRMVDVSFESASLRDVTFSNGCNLASVKPPTDGRHELIAKWPDKLRKLLEQAQNWPSSAGKAASALANIYLIHARSQDWFILNRDDVEDEVGSEVADLIWQSLAASPRG